MTAKVIINFDKEENHLDISVHFDSGTSSHEKVVTSNMIDVYAKSQGIDPADIELSKRGNG